MEDLLALGAQVLDSQPFSRKLGAQLVRFEPGRAVIALPLTDDLKQQHGFAHGGVLSYLADNAITFAGGTVLGASVLTSEYKINYVRPAKGERLVATARVLHHGRSQAVCACEIVAVHGSHEQTVAFAQGTVVRTRRAEAGP